MNDVSGIDIAFDLVDEVDFNKNILKVGIFMFLLAFLGTCNSVPWYSLSISLKSVSFQVSGANHTVQKVG